MAKKTTTQETTAGMVYAFDAGNGGCKGVSSERNELIQFEPCIAPITDKRALNKEDEKPRYSLRVDGETMVFGVDDCFEHGKRTAIRRLNSQERYLSGDYYNLIRVLFLQTFAAHRGNSEPIVPTGVISVPIKQYNEAETIEEIRKTLVGKHTLVDAEGCELRLEIWPKRLILLPESTGALFHYAYDPKKLEKRPDAALAGVTLVLDLGYETCNCSLYEGPKYQRDRGYTIPRVGMGVVTRAIQDQLKRVMRSVDVNLLDRALRPIAGKTPGSKKSIEAAPGVVVDVTESYDAEIADLAAKIAQEVLTHYTETPARILITGGGSHHLTNALSGHFEGLPVVNCPDPETANVQGAFTFLRQQAAKQ